MPAYLADSSVADAGELDLAVRPGDRHGLSLPGCHGRFVERLRRISVRRGLLRAGVEARESPTADLGPADEAQQASSGQQNRAATLCSRRCKGGASAGSSNIARPSAVSRRVSTRPVCWPPDLRVARLPDCKNCAVGFGFLKADHRWLAAGQLSACLPSTRLGVMMMSTVRRAALLLHYFQP